MKTISCKLVVYITLSFIISLTSTAQGQNNTDAFVVVLDAGHGGDDPGRPTKNGYVEKHIALDITLLVGKALEKNKNIKVIYTRKTDVFVTLRNRAKIANKADADLFVSIHCNAHHTQAYGTETFVLGSKNSERNMAVAKAENEVIFLEDNYEEHYSGFDPSSPESSIAIGIEQEVYVEQSIILARKIENNFKHQLKRKSRGIKQASLWVMHNTYMPSVLVETGFITNKNEGAFLYSKNGQKKIASAIADAITSYKSVINNNVDGHDIKAKTPNTPKTSSRIIKDVTFKVQIAASARNLKLKPYNFKGLTPLSKTKVGNMYKYYYGESSDFNAIKVLKNKAKSKGYKSAFIVAFKNKKQISVKKALQ